MDKNIIKCFFCGEEFIQKRIDSKFCSKKCSRHNWIENNKDKYLENRRLYRIKNRDNINSYYRKRLKTKKYIEYRKKYVQKNKLKIKLSLKKYHKLNYEKIKKTNKI